MEKTRIQNVLRLSKRLKPYGVRIAGAVASGVGHQLSIVAVSAVCAYLTGLAIEGKLLERKKADSQRKKDVLHLETGPEQRIDIFQEKIAVFKIPQRPQIAETAKEHQRFPHFRGIFF